MFCIPHVCGKIDENVKPHRFLRPDEINEQILPRKPPILQPNILTLNQKFARVGRKSQSGIVPFISFLPPIVQLPGHQMAHIESSFNLEASLPILSNQNDMETEPTTVASTRRSTLRSATKTNKDYGLDEQEENEVKILILFLI